MATVLGMRGSGHFEKNVERPLNWRQGISLLTPNTKAPLTAIQSFLKNESTDDAEFNWFEKGLAIQSAQINGAVADPAATSIVFDDDTANIFRAGHVIMNTRTLEGLWVIADPTDGKTVTVARGKARTAAAINDDDVFIIMASAHEEGAGTPTPVSYDATKVKNYTQIHRTPLSHTRTAKATKLRTGNRIKEAKREAMELHGTGIEKQTLFGAAVEDLTGDQPKRTSKGIVDFVTTNTKDWSGSLNWDDFMDELEKVFRYGAPEKLLLAGSTLITTLAKMAKDNFVVETVPTTETYGIKIKRFITPHGDLMVTKHPLLTETEAFTDWGFICDTDNLIYRYLVGADTQYLPDRQDNGTDGDLSEFLTECGLELHHEKTFAVWMNGTDFTP